MKGLIVTLTLVLGLWASTALLVSPAPAYADAFSSSNAKGQACSGINGSENAGACTAPGKSIDSIIKTVLEFLSAVVGVITVVMVIVAGFKFATASGDAGKIASARSTLMYALIGLAIVAMAQGIVQLALREVTKPPVTLQPAPKKP